MHRKKYPVHDKGAYPLGRASSSEIDPFVALARDLADNPVVFCCTPAILQWLGHEDTVGILGDIT